MPWPGPPVTARAVRTYIEGLFGGHVPAPELAVQSAWGGPQAAMTGTLLEALETLDQRVTVEGLTIEQAFQWSTAVSRMRNMLDAWRAGHEQTFSAANVATIYNLLAGCPEEPTARTLPRMKFVRDARLRKSIARDIDSLEPLLRDREWKAATVIGGSIVEALLLDRLLRNRTRAAAAVAQHVAARDANWPKQAPAVHALTFQQMIVIAQDLGLIDSVVAGVCDGARDYRNLIHPGKERVRQPCDRATALTAQAAVEALVQVFSGARR